MPLSTSSSRRVVVTGLGAISPLGRSFRTSWEALRDQQSGIVSLTEALACQNLEESQLAHELDLVKRLPCQVAAPVRDCPSPDGRTARFVQFALRAAQDAIEQAQLNEWLGLPNAGEPNISAEPDVLDPNITDVKPEIQARRERTGVCLASNMSSLREVAQAYQILQSNYRKLSPHFVPKVLANSAAGRVALQYHLQGPNHAGATACAAGTHAIGDAFRFLQHGAADVMLAGGTEAAMDPLSLAGFCRLRALSTQYNETPRLASRPFDRHRDGFVMGEGAAVLVLEDLEHALRRKAPILAEVTGYGLTGDAHHITAPDPHGRGAVRCMQQALEEHHQHSQKHLTRPCPVQYVNAHATSTPKGDEIEANAIDQVFRAETGRQISPVWVSSTKGATGHLLGATGALEAAFGVQSLVDQCLIPTANLSDVDLGDRNSLDHVHLLQGADVLREPALEAVMSNSFGFGGTNASLVFRRWTGMSH